MTNIFLITSCIIPPESPIDGETRNVYTKEQRLEQTINTINSIREKVPNSYCIIIELSKLDEEQKNIISDLVDHFIDLSEDRIAQHYMEHNKSVGDLYSTLQ